MFDADVFPSASSTSLLLNYAEYHNPTTSVGYLSCPRMPMRTKTCFDFIYIYTFVCGLRCSEVKLYTIVCRTWRFPNYYKY